MPELPPALPLRDPPPALPAVARLRIALGRARRDAWLTAVDWVAYAGCGGRIGGGVFSGMRYLPVGQQHAVSPKMTGAYEVELLPLLTWAVTAGFRRFINVGSAEGYYCVGMARAVPGLQVDAFEADRAMHSWLAKNAARNGVQDRIRQHGWADPASLQTLLADSVEPLVLVDIEGGERSLLDPATVPGLAGAWLLVELHPAEAPDVLPVLCARFAPTHRAFLFAQSGWDEAGGGRAHQARLHWLARAKCFRAERRAAPTPWLFLQPRSSRLPPTLSALANAREL